MDKIKTYVVFDEPCTSFQVVRAFSVSAARHFADTVSVPENERCVMRYPNHGLWLWTDYSTGALCWAKTPEEAMKLLEIDNTNLVKIIP